MKDIITLPAYQIVELIKSKAVSSEEVTVAFLKQIEAINPSINAVIDINRDATLTQAKQADKAIKEGKDLGPLHGLPMTIKDTINIFGYCNRYGSHLFDGYQPEQEGTCITRLRAAGAVFLGLTNVPELLAAYEADNLLYGATCNPYDLNRSSGGSSGGEAAILALNGSALGLGSDGGGSIRLPAHYCGIAGLKPTQGRIPISGIALPAGGGAGCLQAFGTYGPMARYVDDLILALPVLSGPDGIDPTIPSVPLESVVPLNFRRLKVAYFTNNGIVTPSQDIIDAVLRAAKVFADLGAAVEEARPLGIEKTFELHWEPFFDMCDGGASVMNMTATLASDKISPLRKKFYERAKKINLNSDELNRRFVEILEFKWNTYNFLNQYDILITPTCATVAKPHGECFNEIKDFTYTMSFNNSGSPAVSVPFGMSAQGLPIGVQVVANLWKEHVVLAAAKVLETAQLNN